LNVEYTVFYILYITVIVLYILKARRSSLEMDHNLLFLLSQDTKNYGLRDGGGGGGGCGEGFLDFHEFMGLDSAVFYAPKKNHLKNI